MTTTPVRIGLLGCGNVGAALVQLVERRRDEIASRHGIDLQITRVAVRNLSRERAVELDEGVLTHDADAVVTDPDIDLVVEVIGGIEPARELIATALAAGKPVVTANKELLANVGGDVFAAADARGVDVFFEAAAAGAIPIVRPLRESLLGEDITRILGIVNGTTNYVLTRMSEDGAAYSEALTEAQRLEAEGHRILKLNIGQSTPPFGTLEEGVRVLMLCGRDDPAAEAGGPDRETILSQMEEDRINKRAQRYLRDLRRDAVIDYN